MLSSSAKSPSRSSAENVAKCPPAVMCPAYPASRSPIATASISTARHWNAMEMPTNKGGSSASTIVRTTVGRSRGRLNGTISLLYPATASADAR
jgi:hypothetical protein